MDRVLDCQFYRRFGVEIELNTLDGVVRKLDKDKGETPFGATEVAFIIRKTLNKPVEIHDWHSTHNNKNWIVKPDSSCGIEICSPILKGWRGLASLIKVIASFREAGMKADQRCSLHVHVNIADLDRDQLASVIAYFIKCEHVIFDSLPSHRKINRYCQFLGMSDLFYDNFKMDPDELISRVSGSKYYSLNAYHFYNSGGFNSLNNRKKTIEFRVAENEACLDPFFTKNWIRFLLHFVEVTKNLPLPHDYREGDPWSGLLWLNPKDVFKILKFDEPMSDGLRQMKDWFIGRIMKNGYDSGLPGVFSNAGRQPARLEFLEMVGDQMFITESGPVGYDLLLGKKYIK
jgi:hypothetical protein